MRNGDEKICRLVLGLAVAVEFSYSLAYSDQHDIDVIWIRVSQSKHNGQDPSLQRMYSNTILLSQDTHSMPLRHGILSEDHQPGQRMYL
jgi:hypothetical protein